MNIKTRLTLQFISLVAFILIAASFAIYFFSADYREEDFYNRLYRKATNTAKLLIEVEEVDAELLRRMEADNPVRMPEERISIINFRNEVVFTTDDDNVLTYDPELLNEIRLDQEVRYTTGEYEVLGFLFSDKYDRFIVLIAATDVYGKGKLNNLRTVLLLVFGISIILVFVAGRIYSYRALKPITAVIRQVDNISISSLNLRVDEGNGKDEIARLAATFNQMLTRLEGAFKIQKNFIANASHELRTPLTAIIGQLEVLLMKERSNEEYKSALSSVIEDMKNLGTTANRLLLLAQTSAENQDLNFKQLRIDDVIWQVYSEIRKHNQTCSIDIQFSEELDEHHLTVNGNEQLLRIVFVNLLENACKYSMNTPVFVRVGINTSLLQVEIKDHGIGIDPVDLDHIFEPFHRGKNSLNFKGHGIGLSLVDKIVKLHQAKIGVTSKLGSGTTFLLSIPHL
ncbi:MAG TPA: two-component sensor histidine kinase [Flavobacteriales bacterium]|nr:two-component sensor histidine kinase [Flavobacteriales bacterium]